MANAETNAPAAPETKVRVKTEPRSRAPSPAMPSWRPFDNLRREVDRVFEDYLMDPLRLPFRRPVFEIEPFWQPASWITAPRGRPRVFRLSIAHLIARDCRSSAV